MITALVEAYCRRRRIESGQAKSIADLAAQEKVTDAYAAWLVAASGARAAILFDAGGPVEGAGAVSLLGVLREVRCHERIGEDDVC